VCYVGVALAALLFCFVIIVPYLRGRIDRMFDDNGERKSSAKGDTSYEGVAPEREGDPGSFFAISSPYSFLRRLRAWFHPSHATEINESNERGT
jgi:hypothetical protein